MSLFPRNYNCSTCHDHGMVRDGDDPQTERPCPVCFGRDDYDPEDFAEPEPQAFYSDEADRLADRLDDYYFNLDHGEK